MLTLAIPNRNGALYLEQTLASLQRNRPYVQWWLQDSCSSDESVEIARRYASPADHIEVERDSCQAEGLNKAIERMGGDIIGFLNSDDCLSDGAAEAVIAAFRADPNLEMVYGQVEWIDPDGRIQGVHQGEISSLAEVLDIYRVWWMKKQWVQPEVFWRRSLWNRVGKLNEALDLAFDYEYWVRCFSAGVKVKRIPRVLAQFRRHPAQKSTNSKKAADEIRSVVFKNLARPNSLNPRHAFDLRNRLSYDLYQSDQTSSQRNTFGRALWSHPRWLALPEVRSRLCRAGIWKAFTRGANAGQ